MRCPNCRSDKSKIKMNWAVEWVIIRIRKCLDCGKEYETQEKVAPNADKLKPTSCTHT